MSEERNYHALREDQIKTLIEQGCSALDWSKVQVEDGFNPLRVRNTHFSGRVRIGRLAGNVKSKAGREKASGIYHAYIADCIIGRDVRIANIGLHIANYEIGDGACIEDVGTMDTTPGASFGNGVEAEVLNEGGGREVTFFNELSSQFAYLECLHRYRTIVVQKLRQIAGEYAGRFHSDQGKVGPAAGIWSVGEIINVNIGPGAIIDGAASLVNGTILSSPDAPTLVGGQVIAKDFIIAEGSAVTSGAILSKSFIGQGCQVGKGYSAENSLFFANSEAFHGEGCSVFGGPYTVTHHKSTLLIAGLFSFYNAGSGSNQSNHMYKLGPVHEGKLARGTKTGSFSYMMWPCRVGPFSVVLGKHTGTFDTSDFPFSHIEARADGKALMVPGLNLSTVGTIRDGAKWPARDRRKAKIKRDVISFDVLSPYTVGGMIKANAVLKDLQDKTDKSVEEVALGGTLVKRVLLRTSQKFYRSGIETYLLEKVVQRLENKLAGGAENSAKIFGADQDAVYSSQWVDIGGQLMPQDRLENICRAIENGQINTVEQFQAAFNQAHQLYERDEWAWVYHAYRDYFGVDLVKITGEDILQIVQDYSAAKGKFLRLIIADAQKEFSEQSRSGFGQDGAPVDAPRDFLAVRGSFENNKFVKDMQNQLLLLEQRVQQLRQRAEKLR